MGLFISGWTGDSDKEPGAVPASPAGSVRAGRRRLSGDEHHWNPDGVGEIASLFFHLRLHGRQSEGLPLDGRCPQSHPTETEPGTTDIFFQ